MRNYWLRIFLGAFAIFTIGMIGVTLIRSGVDRVHSVVEGDGPIDIPLRFIPFTMGGERLGKLDRVIFYRSDSRRVRAVELMIDLGDSLLAQGLSGCRLAANLEGGPSQAGVHIKASHNSKHTFRCLPGDSIPETMVEFGEAVFQPGDIRVPLFLQRELVAELEEGFGGDSGTAVTINSDSIASEAQREVDSALAEAGLTRSADRGGRSLGDSIREAARAKLDSARRASAE